MRYFINGVPQTAPAVTVGNTLEFGGITVPAGGNVTILYDARVNGFADPTEGGSVTNTVTVTGGGITPLTASATVPANAAALLSITKSVSPVPVVENGVLTYTFRIENIGAAPVDAAGNVTVTDTFQPILTGITATLDGVALTRPAPTTRITKPPAPSLPFREESPSPRQPSPVTPPAPSSPPRAPSHWSFPV